MHAESYIHARDKIRKAFDRGIIDRSTARMALLGLFHEVNDLDNCLAVADALLDTDIPGVRCDEARLARIDLVPCGGRS